MEQTANNSVMDNPLDDHNIKTVLTVKYKIYIVVLIIVMVVCWWYLNRSQDAYTGVQQSISALELQKVQKEKDYQEVIKDLIVIKNVNDQKQSIVSCLSTASCVNLPESLADALPNVRAFLQLQKNESEKMSFDQKKILANINEYLLKGNNNQSNGTITSIVFGNLAPVEWVESVVQVPLSLTIDFANKNGLLDFVSNVENTISPRYPMLYKIHSINYDIVNYQKTQEVTIELVGYMMQE